MKKDTKREDFLKVKDELDKISVSTEIIEHLNELINEKLDEINHLNGKKIDLLELNRVLRYNTNYITLNQLITQQLDNINENVQNAYNMLNDLDPTFNTDDK